MSDDKIGHRLIAGTAILAGLLLFAFTNSIYSDGSTAHEMVEWVGVVVMITGVFGRTLCSFYLDGSAGSKLVTEGPYSVTRNPYYYFTMLGAGGAGAQTGSVVVALVCGALAFAVFYVFALRDEPRLTARYGVAFASYKASVPRLLPNPFLWRDVATLTVPAPNISRAITDTMLFLVSVPIAKSLEQLQEHGLLPVLLSLP